jgi:hypothetical protein
MEQSSGFKVKITYQPNKDEENCEIHKNVGHTKRIKKVRAYLS